MSENTPRKPDFGSQLYAVLDIDGGNRDISAYQDSMRSTGAEKLATALLDQLDETPDGTSALPDEAITKSSSGFSGA